MSAPAFSTFLLISFASKGSVAPIRAVGIIKIKKANTNLKSPISILSPPAKEYNGRYKAPRFLKTIGINPELVSRGHFSRYFTAFRHAKILKYSKGRRLWEKGENFEVYLTYIVQQMAAHKKLRQKLSNIMIRYATNSLDYILNQED